MRRLRYVQRSEAFESERNESSLFDFFSPGKLVVAVILTTLQAGQNRLRLEASLRPSLVNAGLTAEQLRQNMWLPTAVVGEEEHVLRLSFGVEDMTGIIKKTEFAKDDNVSNLPQIGCIVMVSVQKVNSSTVKCSLASEPIGHEALDQTLLKPGLLVAARVREVVAAKGIDSDGLLVRFCGITAVIHQHHMGQTEEWKKNQKVVARILAILPEPTPTVQLTLLPHLVEWVPDELSEKAEIGELLVGDVMDFQPKYGCRVQVKTKTNDGKDGESLDGSIGFCSMSKLTDTDKDIVGASVKPGFQAQYRVLSYNFLDGVLLLTRKPSDLEDGALVSVTQLSPGQLVSGTVSNVADHGLLSFFIIPLRLFRFLRQKWGKTAFLMEFKVLFFVVIVVFVGCFSTSSVLCLFYSFPIRGIT